MDHLISNLSIEVPFPNINRERGGWVLSNDHVDDFAWCKDVFTNEELDAIINIGKTYSLDQASIFSGINLEIRNSNVCFLYPNELTEWIFRKLTDVVNMLNAQFFKFDLFSFEEGLQFTSYTAPGQHYDWHIDKGKNFRKLSVSIQLTDPNEYSGGNLELMYGGQPRVVEPCRGLVTVFPSYVVHRVTPVTHGTRHSLVAWISGPPFK